MRLTRYLSVRLVKMAVTATLILAFIAEVLDLVDNAGDIIDRGDGVIGILRYVALRMPTLITHALPLGALIGAILTLLLFARNSEITAMRATGRGVWSLFGHMLPGAIVLTLMHSSLIDVITPRTETALALWLSRPAEAAGDKEEEAKPIWFRIGEDVISFERVKRKGRAIKSVRIYERDANKIVTARTTAAEADFENGRWILKGAERVSWMRETLNERTPADGVWETTLTPEDVLSALTPESRISLTAARAVLAGRQTPNAPLSFYETLVERVYSAPLGVVVMVLLAMPAALVNWRDAKTGRYGLTALAAGLFFLLSDGLLSTVAMSGLIAPLIGAWASVVGFTLFGAWRLWRIDAGWPVLKRRRDPSRSRLAEAAR